MAAKKDPEPTGLDKVQERATEHAEKGYRGFVPDPTPNENYTVAGVTAGKPTPETDDALRDEARKAAAR